MRKDEHASISIIKIICISALLILFSGIGVMAANAKVKNVRIVFSNNYELNALDWSTNVSFVSSSAFIYIDNQSSVGVSFYEGSTPVTTSTGGKIINRTGHLIFEIPMPSIGTGAKKSYASKVNVAAYKVGTAASQSIYITGDASTTKELEAGKMYTLTVTGENYHSLSCSFSDEVVDIDPDVEIN